jgi:hypothetical protein
LTKKTEGRISRDTVPLKGGLCAKYGIARQISIAAVSQLHLSLCYLGFFMVEFQCKKKILHTTGEK